MTKAYDTYYRTESLFGEPQPELIRYFREQGLPGKVLDLGCGQGRDALALARLGFSVTGMDSSHVGIGQLQKHAAEQGLMIRCEVGDIYQYNDFRAFDFILLDSMFHFGKKEKAREIALIEKIIDGMRSDARVVFCIQDSGTKVPTLLGLVENREDRVKEHDEPFVYRYEDGESGHSSVVDYRLIVIRKGNLK